MNPDITEFESRALVKPAKGSALLDRRDRKAKIVAYEKQQKAKVVQRDGSHTCRLVSGCTERTHHETAHVHDKGMGGDHSLRSSSADMVRSCLFHHRGAWSLHSGDIKVEMLTEAGADGPIEVYGKDKHEQWYLLKREVRCNEVERD